MLLGLKATGRKNSFLINVRVFLKSHGQQTKYIFLPTLTQKSSRPMEQQPHSGPVQPKPHEERQAYKTHFVGYIIKSHKITVHPGSV